MQHIDSAQRQKVQNASAWHATLLGLINCTGLDRISAMTIFMTRTHQYVCASCVDCGMFVMHYPTLRAVKTQIG